MLNKKLKVGLMGCGRIANRHAELLSGGHIDDANLCAVCDVKQERARAFSSKYGVASYSDAKEMILAEKLDILVVLTPSGMHAANVIALTKYVKNIVVEKPMALKLDDAKRMLEATKANNTKLFVVKQNRYNIPVVQARRALDHGRFGKLIMGTIRVRWCREQSYYDQDGWRGTWEMDGGVLANQASHHLDLLTWMMGDVLSVHAYSTKALANIEAEDTAVAVIKFENGALGTIEATTATRPKDLEGSLSIIGSEGSIEISGFAVNRIRHWNFLKEKDEDNDIKTIFSENPPNVYGFGHKSYYENVVKSINENIMYAVDGKSGMESLKLLHAIYHSIENGKEIFISDQPTSQFLGKESN